MAQRNLDDFLDTFATANREVHDIKIAGPGSGAPLSPFIVVRAFDKVAVINPQNLGDHLSVDVHSFVDGNAATGGVFGMSNGRRWTLPETGTTSHGWNSAGLVAVLVGKQDEGRTS